MKSISACFAGSFLLLAAAASHAADHASGSIALGSTTGAIQHAVMVRGPDEMDAKHSILRIYLSSSDIAARVRACKTLACADAALEDGAMVDYSEASHLPYAVRLDHERKQYSGATDADAFTLTAKAPDHLAGKLHVDDGAMGGAKIDADFDLAVAATFASAR
jgi:hypothetical protein